MEVEVEMLETINAERLHELHRYYIAICDRYKTKPSIRDFVIWLAEENYIDED